MTFWTIKTNRLPFSLYSFHPSNKRCSNKKYNKKTETKNFTVEISTTDQYGYFEHNDYGDECGGGLWFEDNELVDFDGVFALPSQVADAIIEMGFRVDKDIFCEEV